MAGFLDILLLALLPAGGMLAGTLLAELTSTSSRMLSRALHVASGVVLAVVAVELLPETLGGAAPPWAVVLGLCLGGVSYILLEWLIERSGGGGERGGAWLIYTAVAVDLFSDGLMIGVGSVVSLQLALLLGLGQSMADLPEGFATSANFKAKGQPRGRRLLIAASLIAPSLVGAMLGYWLLRDRSEALQLAALAFTAGILLIAAVEEMLKQAHQAAEDTRLSAAFLIGGFSLFTIFASYFNQ